MKSLKTDGAVESSTEAVKLPDGSLTDESLQNYADGKFYEDVKQRGQELAEELLQARQRIRALEADLHASHIAVGLVLERHGCGGPPVAEGGR